MINSFFTCRRIILLTCLIAFVPCQGIAASLLGDYSCPQWASLEPNLKKTWVDSFLAPLSLAFKSIQGEKRDHYNEDSRSAGNAVTFVDSYCALHPDQVAADAAGAFFKMMMSQ